MTPHEERRLRRAVSRLTREPITDLELDVIRLLAKHVRYGTGAAGTKRFVAQISGVAALTLDQRRYLWRITWRYRRQLVPSIVAEAGKRHAWAHGENEVVAFARGMEAGR